MMLVVINQYNRIYVVRHMQLHMNKFLILSILIIQSEAAKIRLPQVSVYNKNDEK